MNPTKVEKRAELLRRASLYLNYAMQSPDSVRQMTYMTAARELLERAIGASQ